MHERTFLNSATAYTVLIPERAAQGDRFHSVKRIFKGLLLLFLNKKARNVSSFVV